jgi:phosphocarrier protein
MSDLEGLRTSDVAEAGDVSSSGGPVPEEVHKRFTIVNERGMHLRAAAKLALVTSRFACAVVFKRGKVTATARSVMELLVLRASRGTTIEVVASGVDAPACLAAIGDLVANGFGEAD